MLGGWGLIWRVRGERHATFWAEAAEGAGAGTAVLRVGAGPDAGLAALLVHLVGRALAQRCVYTGPGEQAGSPGPCPPPSPSPPGLLALALPAAS